MDRRQFFRAGMATAAVVPLVGKSTVAALAQSDEFAAEADLIPPDRLLHWAPMFYMRLLEQRVKVLPIDRESFGEGRRLTDRSISGRPFIQRSLTSYERTQSEHVIQLADTVAQISKRVRFASLLIPKNGVISSSSHRYRDVTFRELAAYEIRNDLVLMRLDVLFTDES